MASGFGLALSAEVMKSFENYVHNRVDCSDLSVDPCFSLLPDMNSDGQKLLTFLLWDSTQVQSNGSGSISVVGTGAITMHSTLEKFNNLFILD